jgi:glycosyltransferase involved in cell wall biosynthesis
LKILIINYEFPPLGGGAGNASYYLAKHLSMLGHKITVLTSAFDDLPKEEQLDGFRILRIPVARRRLDRCSVFEMITFLVSGLFHCNTIINRFKPEKIVAFFGIPSGIISYWIRRRYSLPYIVSLRGGDVPGFFAKKLRYYHFLTKPIIKNVWKNAEHVIVNSNRLYELTKHTDPKLKIPIIPNGVDINKYKPKHGEYSKNSRIRILTVGRLNEQKGLKTLLKACHTLNQNGLNGQFSLEILGDGPSRRALEKLTKDLHLQDIVYFTGWVSKTQLTDKYNTSDIFALPSLDEGMSNALLEAMATGLPVVASDFAGDNLLVNDVNALVVPVNNDQLLSIALKQLILDKDLREKLGQKGIMITKKYSWENAARAYESLCQKHDRDI